MSNPSTREIVQAAGGLDQAIDTAPVRDAAKIEAAARALLKAYYGSEKDAQNVDWSDIQEAVTAAAEAFDLDENILAEMQVESVDEVPDSSPA